MKSRLFNLVKVIISIGLLFLLFRTFDFRQSWDALRGMDIRYFIVALFLFDLSLVLRSFRWRFLLEAVEVHVPFHRLVYLYFVGTFFNTFLPSGFGGDAIKMYELARYSQKGSEAISTVFLDRLAGIIMLFIMGLLALPFAFRSLPDEEALILLIVSVGGLLATWVLFQRSLADRVLAWGPARFRAKLQSLYDAVHTSGTRALWKALAVSAIFNLSLFTLNHFIALSLRIKVPFLYFIAFMPIISLSMLLPSVGALGTREGAYVLLFGAAGVSEPIAMAMSLAFYLISVLTGIVGGLLYAVEALKGLGAQTT